MKSSIFLIEGCNFEDFPTGGQLSFCTQLLHVFPGNYFNLIGITTNPKYKVGQWNALQIEGRNFHFFPVYFATNSSKKAFIPSRLKFFLSLRKYRNRLFEGDIAYHLFTHAPETLLALNLRKRNFTILHFLHGVENPLSISRYRWAKYFSQIFWNLYLNRLSQIKYIAATADQENIQHFKKANQFNKAIVGFPTRFDDHVYKCLATQKTGPTTFVFCGRINRFKGWELLIDSFHLFVKKYKQARLVIIGDGEDRILLEKYIRENDLKDKVILTGFLNKKEIAEQLNNAHVFLLPSLKEGWPIALVEALACGLPIVATNVSGVKDMVIPNVNGYIVNERESNIFADFMYKSTHLESPNKKSLDIAKSLSQSSLKQSLFQSFPDFFSQE